MEIPEIAMCLYKQNIIYFSQKKKCQQDVAMK